MRRQVSCHRVASSSVSPSVDVSVDTQSTWVGSPYKARICMLLDADSCRLLSRILSKRQALFLGFSDSSEVKKVEGAKAGRQGTVVSGVKTQLTHHLHHTVINNLHHELEATGG